MKNFRVRFRFLAEDDEDKTKEKIESITSLASAGVEFDQDKARELTGQPKPQPGAAVFGGKESGPAIPGMEGLNGAPDEEDDGEDDADHDGFDEFEKRGTNGKPGMNGHAERQHFAETDTRTVEEIYDEEFTRVSRLLEARRA
jgi:hypothetical protein